MERCVVQIAGTIVRAAAVGRIKRKIDLSEADDFGENSEDVSTPSQESKTLPFKKRPPTTAALLQRSADQSNEAMKEIMSSATSQIVDFLASSREAEKKERKLDREERKRYHDLELIERRQDRKERRAQLDREYKERRQERLEEADARRKEWMEMLTVLMQK